jgi:hypothetical protein
MGIPPTLKIQPVSSMSYIEFFKKRLGAHVNFQKETGIYPLVMTKIAIQNGHRNSSLIYRTKKWDTLW